MRIDSAGRLLLNRTASTGSLTLESQAPSGFSVGAGFYSGLTQSVIEFKDSTTTANYKVRIGSATDDMVMYSGGTETMRIDSTGKVGIGTSSPSSNLHVANTSSFAAISIQAANTQASHVFFGDTEDVDIGRISYSHDVNSMLFRVNTAEAMRIDSSGNLLVGTTTSDSDVLANINGTLAITNNNKIFPKSLGLADDVATTYITFNLPSLSAFSHYANIGAEISYAIITNRYTSARAAQTTYGKVYIAISRDWETSGDAPVAVTLVDTDKSLAFVKTGMSDPTITWTTNITGGTDATAKTVQIIVQVNNTMSNLTETRINGLVTAHISGNPLPITIS
jgi:hypothetical protein